MKPNGFDVMKTMSERNLDIMMAPLENITYLQRSKRGTLVTIGVGGDVIASIANGTFIGGLYLINRAQFLEVERELEAEAGK